MFHQFFSRIITFYNHTRYCTKCIIFITRYLPGIPAFILHCSYLKGYHSNCISIPQGFKLSCQLDDTNFMFCSPSIPIHPCNETLLDTLFILRLFRQSTSTCFGRICNPSSGGILYTGCNRRNGPNFGRVFLMLNYTEKPQNTYIQS